MKTIIGNSMFILILGALTFSAHSYAQIDIDNLASVCTAIFDKDNIVDRNFTLDTVELYEKTVSFLQTESFSSYEQFSSRASSAGLNVGTLTKSIGFSQGAQRNAGTFKEELDTFLSKSYSETNFSSLSQGDSRVLSTGIVGLVETCLQTVQKIALERPVGETGGIFAYATPSAELNGFLLEVRWDYKGDDDLFSINSIVSIPLDSVVCSERNGETLSYPRQLGKEESVTFSCTKPATKRVSVSVNTGLGTSEVITILGTDDLEQQAEGVLATRISVLETSLLEQKAVWQADIIEGLQSLDVLTSIYGSQGIPNGVTDYVIPRSEGADICIVNRIGFVGSESKTCSVGRLNDQWVGTNQSGADSDANCNVQCFSIGIDLR